MRITYANRTFRNGPLDPVAGKTYEIINAAPLANGSWTLLVRSDANDELTVEIIKPNGAAHAWVVETEYAPPHDAEGVPIPVPAEAHRASRA